MIPVSGAMSVCPFSFKEKQGASLSLFKKVYHHQLTEGMVMLQPGK
jgi:hypothetical protein